MGVLSFSASHTGLVYIFRLCLLVIWAFCPTTTVYSVSHIFCYFLFIFLVRIWFGNFRVLYVSIGVLS